MQYASTFITGMQAIVLDALRSTLPEVRIERLDDGIILYTTSAPPEKIQSIRFFHNTFVVITPCEGMHGHEPLKQLVKAVREDAVLDEKLKHLLKKRKNYTIMASVENQPASIPFLQKQKLEKTLSAVHPLLVSDRKNPDLEFWLLVRKEGYGFFGLRLMRHEQYDHAPEKGELRPELAHLLCLLSEPSAQDRFLDPFCGSGAIPMERVTAFPFLDVWATDSNPQLIRQLRDKVKRLKLRMHVDCLDVLRLKVFHNGSFDKIVTDPPWGVFQGKNIGYVAMLRELGRVTKKGGLIVLLLSRREPLEKVLYELSTMELLQRFDILVSGQKATVYKLRVL